MSRPDWDKYFLNITLQVARRATCKRHEVGAVVVRDKRILVTGYNGAPRGFRDCLELGCLRDELKIPSGTRHEVCRALHAEQNCVAQGAFNGVSLAGGTMYCTHSPCRICAKLLVQAGIIRFVALTQYADGDFVNVFLEGKVAYELRFAT
jgi:dCMP deaminase